MKLHKGMRVKCEIEGQKVDDAKIQEWDGSYYICQNVRRGNECPDKLGYACSWQIGNGSSEDLYYRAVTNLRLLSTNIEYVYEGSTIQDYKGQKRKVLGICGEVVFVSNINDFNTIFTYSTKQELKIKGYILVPETPVEVEEKMIEIDGKKFSKSTIKEALKRYCA